MLGFTVVNVQQRFDKVKDNTHVEASILLQIYRDSEVFSPESGDLIRNAIKSYISNVVNDEWPLMADGKSSPKAEKSLDSIWRAYYDVEFEKAEQQTWYAESTSKLNQLMKVRVDRLVGSIESLGSEMWSSLILGGLLVISFLWFFGLDSLWAHILMASTIALSIAFLLFLIYSLDTTFSGGVNIAPEAFEKVLSHLN